MNERITLDYGSGGLKTAELIDNILLPAFDNPALSSLGDGALLAGNRQLVFSTDSFVVTPWKFPGGDIGKLSVCGTVNDVCMAGGDPKYLSLSFILEEGFLFSDFRDIVASIAREAKKPVSPSSPVTPRWWRPANATASISTPPASAFSGQLCPAGPVSGPATQCSSAALSAATEPPS